MTTGTPCLSGCYKVPIVDAAGDDCMPDYRLARTVHVPNCPNAPKAAEPQGSEGSESSNLRYADDIRDHEALKFIHAAVISRPFTGWNVVMDHAYETAGLRDENSALKARVAELEDVIVEYREAGKLISGSAIDRGLSRSVDYGRVDAASRAMNAEADTIRAHKEQEVVK